MADPTLPARLAEARRHKGLAQEALARLIGFSTRTINRWERGISYPREGAQQRLTETLDLPPDFFNGNGDAGVAA